MKGFPGLGGNMQGMMKHVQKMQEELAAVQAELEHITVEAEAGGGMVKVTANGKQRITKITIDKELFNPQEVEMLEDLVVAAVNKVLDESSKKAQTELGKVTGGLLSGIPGLGSLGL